MIEKGDFGGRCARKVCPNEPAMYFNESTHQFYCKPCAMLINESHERFTKPDEALYGKPICTSGSIDKRFTRAYISSHPPHGVHMKNVTLAVPSASISKASINKAIYLQKKVASAHIPKMDVAKVSKMVAQMVQAKRRSRQGVL